MFTDALAIFMVFSVPLSVIGGIFYLKAKKLQLQEFNSDERQVLLQLKQENAALRDRLDSIETIVSEIDHTILISRTGNQQVDAAKRIETLRREIEG